MKITSKYKHFIKAVNIRTLSTKDRGIVGEKVAAEYLKKNGFLIEAINVKASFGELDIIARKSAYLHFIEVKTRACKEFPLEGIVSAYGPENNLHMRKISKVSRLGLWYVAKQRWEGEWQVDGIAVWLRECDGMAKVTYYPQLW